LIKRNVNPIEQKQVDLLIFDSELKRSQAQIKQISGKILKKKNREKLKIIQISSVPKFLPKLLVGL